MLLIVAMPAAAEPYETPLSTGKLFVPDGYKPTDGKIDLVVHFHGTADRVKKAFVESNRAAALVIVSWEGLSGVYSEPFTNDRKLFGKILADAQAKLAEHYGVKKIEIRRLVVTSFSAGFGAIKEILRDPEYLNKINDLIMLDSIHAGYIEENGKNAVNPENMPSFEAMAKRAAEGKATMWITHSEVVPGDYASTTECAEYLARKVGAKIVPASGEDAPGMKLLTKSDLKGFHVRGYAGDDGPAHWNHVYSVGAFLKWTALEERH